nr:MAG TPA_asm: hypothetical protein [Caudoviricetes sp.]
MGFVYDFNFHALASFLPYHAAFSYHTKKTPRYLFVTSLSLFMGVLYFHLFSLSIEK